MILIPDIIIFNTFKTVLKIIRDDYKNNLTDTTKSLLYRLLSSNVIQRYDLFKEAVSIFINNTDDPRHFDINLQFNAKRAAIPTGHIVVNSENEKDNAINNSEGFRDPGYNDDGTTLFRTFNRRFTTKYDIIFTSDNLNEVILMYHFFKSISISLNEHFNASGLENIKLSGNSINLNSEIVPINIFAKALSISFDYDCEGQELFSNNINIFDIVGTQLIIDNSINS